MGARLGEEADEETQLLALLHAEQEKAQRELALVCDGIRYAKVGEPKLWSQLMCLHFRYLLAYEPPQEQPPPASAHTAPTAPPKTD